MITRAASFRCHHAKINSLLEQLEFVSTTLAIGAHIVRILQLATVNSNLQKYLKYANMRNESLTLQTTINSDKKNNPKDIQLRLYISMSSNVAQTVISTPHTQRLVQSNAMVKNIRPKLQRVRANLPGHELQ
eukprot:1774452-Amphidinium_carterae.1